MIHSIVIKLGINTCWIDFILYTIYMSVIPIRKYDEYVCNKSKNVILIQMFTIQITSEFKRFTR